MVKPGCEFINRVGNQLVTAAQEGDFDALDSCLDTVSNPADYINRLYDGEHSIKRTLLTIACLNKHEGFLNQFLFHYKPDLEVSNVVELEDVPQNCTIFFGVSALWVAAFVGSFEIVRLLVEHGAQVNHVTATNSTALRCACCQGNLDMVRYLVEKGGDIHIAKETNDTNFTASFTNRHWHVVTYLVDEKGFDVNECDAKGRSPLYMAARSGSLEITQFLLHRGARHFPSTDDRMSPLMWAAETRHTDIFNAILPHCSMLEQIEGEELFGSAWICDPSDKGDFERAFEHFSRALDLRAQHALPKTLKTTTMEIFGNRREHETIDALEAIRSNTDAMWIDALYEMRPITDEMWIEAMLVRERLLGPTNEEYLYSIRHYGAAMADREECDRTVALWLYEVQLRRQHGFPIDRETLQFFADTVSGTLIASSLPTIDTIETVIAVSAEYLDNLSEKFDDYLHKLLFLITIASRVLDSRMTLWFHLFYSHRSWPSQTSRLQIEGRSTDNSTESTNANGSPSSVGPLSCI